METETIAAGVLVVEDGHVLAISRGVDRANLGIPGGHLESDDLNPRHGAARELFEETGVVVYPPHLRFLESNPADSGMYVAYYAPDVVSFPAVLRSVPFEGFVGWHHPSELLGPEVTHRDFYRRLFNKIGL